MVSRKAKRVVLPDDLTIKVVLVLTDAWLSAAIVVRKHLYGEISQRRYSAYPLPGVGNGLCCSLGMCYFKNAKLGSFFEQITIYVSYCTEVVGAGGILVFHDVSCGLDTMMSVGDLFVWYGQQSCT